MSFQPGHKPIVVIAAAVCECRSIAVDNVVAILCRRAADPWRACTRSR
jgi:hypothetical protein